MLTETHFCGLFFPWSSCVGQQSYSLQRQLDDRRLDIGNLKQERQSLLGLVRSLNSDIQDLKRQISGHEKTNQDKVGTITAESSSSPGVVIELKV